MLGGGGGHCLLDQMRVFTTSSVQNDFVFERDVLEEERQQSILTSQCRGPQIFCCGPAIVD